MLKNVVRYSFILLLVLFISISAKPVHAASQCRWIYSSQNDAGACQRRFGNSEQSWNNNLACDATKTSATDNTCCCPVTASKKPWIISGVVAFFAIITTFILIVRKND